MANFMSVLKFKGSKIVCKSSVVSSVEFKRAL